MERLRPIDLLDPLGVDEVVVDDALRQIEIFTPEGLLLALWHGPVVAERVVILLGGGLGGTLGPAGALYHRLGRRLAASGIGTIRVHYRRPGDLERCVVDAGAVADLAAQRGARRFVVVGHSFGGAVAINVGAAIPSAVAGVATLATQSAGCQPATALAPRPLLLIHGEDDQIVPAESSHQVRMLAGGHGEVEILAGAGHGLADVAEHVELRLLDWIQSTFAAGSPAE